MTELEILHEKIVDPIRAYDKDNRKTENLIILIHPEDRKILRKEYLIQTNKEHEQTTYTYLGATLLAGLHVPRGHPQIIHQNDVRLLRLNQEKE